MVKIYLKSCLNTFKSNISRFLVISSVILLGVAFTSGLGTLSSTLTDSINDYYKNSNGIDLIIKSKNEIGFTIDEINKIKNNKEVKEIDKITSIDQDNTRIEISNLDYKIIKGKEIKNSNEILVDRTTKVKLNTKVKVFNQEYKVVGIVDNSRYYSKEKELSIYEEKLDHIYYLDSNYFELSYKYITTDLLIKLDHNFNIFSNDYEDYIKDIKKELKNNSYEILTLNENISYGLTKSYGEKIEMITLIFPLFFIAVAALVVYSTITRLLDEERTIIGCYRSLGISKLKIILKYLVFIFLTSLIGSILGFLIGIELLPRVIFPAFEALFYMDKLTNVRVVSPGILTGIIMTISISIISVITIRNLTKEKPCNLLKHKSPPSGKKILLERITFIWKHLSFKYKSSIRNIFRYKSNLFMTIISVTGSTALTFAGFGLYSNVIDPNIKEIPVTMADSFAIIVAIIILFAALLSILVIYNLTNMNIQERVREIASLRVLGYTKDETKNYIYREINITTSLGALLGLPAGYYFLKFVFDFLEFGNMSSVNWKCYLYTILLVIIFVFIAELVLVNKIHKIDMNTSLKSNE